MDAEKSQDVQLDCKLERPRKADSALPVQRPARWKECVTWKSEDRKKQKEDPCLIAFLFLSGLQQIE